jgi:hypothetical protein
MHRWESQGAKSSATEGVVGASGAHAGRGGPGAGGRVVTSALARSIIGAVGVELVQSRPTWKDFEAGTPRRVVAVAVMTTSGSCEGQAGAVQTTWLPVSVLWGAR